MGGSDVLHPLRVVLQCRHRFFRDGLASLLEGRDDLRVLAAVVTLEELVQRCAAGDVDVAVVTLDDVEGVDLTSLVRTLRASRCIALCGDHRRALAASNAGFRTVLTAIEGIDGVLRALLDDEAPRGRLPARPSSYSVLTPREAEVLGLIGEGCTTWEISERLGISRKTVENHKQRIFLKLDVQNQAHAVAVAVRRGLIDVDADPSVAGAV